ncbi:MAG: hypothetical protein HOP29_08300 [Phycisphaerales bacterium]|nr:hypothetical protein [Phycisphaerales bacterium]
MPGMVDKLEVAPVRGPGRGSRVFSHRTSADPPGIESVHGQFIELCRDTREFLQKVGTYLVIPTKPDGSVIGDHGTFHLDAEGGAAIEEEFTRRGNDMLVDFEHQSIPKHARADGLSPAAGWIKALKFVAGKGMVARIEWAGDVADMLRAKVYRYLSPVFYTDQREHVVGLKNVALTNQPAIHGFPPLANSKHTKGIIVNTTTAEPTAAAGAPVVNAAGDAADESATVMDQLRAALGLADDATDADVLSACLARLQTPADAVPQSIRASLDLDDKADATMVVSAIKGLRQVAVPVHQYEALRRERMREQADDLCINKAHGIDKKLCLVEAEYERDQLLADPANFDANLVKFKRRMEFRSPMVTSGRLIQPDSGSAGDGERRTVVATARTEFEADPRHGKVTSRAAFVNMKLSDAGLALLTDAERTQLA